ncbi:MAG TPA: right-handed parallel beta-helix repeat-containing protein [Tepidisphaeraceae bacterium]|jgi:hypothetical protein|nr:right-handed parallel beta-helix repeat-containing protein [Tepidisphaeraceae bacterium]
MNEFSITTDGDDTAPEGPWASLVGARDGLRRLRECGQLKGPARVTVGGGRYAMREAIRFKVADGDTTYVADPNAPAIFDGAERIDGWTETTHAGCRAWVTTVPDVAANRWYFRSLFVRGSRRPRARLPKFTADAKGVANVRRIAELRYPENRKLFAGDNVFKPAAGDVQDWPSLIDAEIVLLHYWLETRLPSPRFDARTGWVRCGRRSVFNLYESFNPKLARYYVDNLYEALSEPGEWYLNRDTGQLTYLPLPDETLEDTEVLAPRLTEFVQVRGQAYNRGALLSEPTDVRPVKGLRFEGLTFRHADWYQPQAEMLPHTLGDFDIQEVPIGSAPQAAAHVPSVINLKFATHCAIDGCTIEHVGFSAVEMGPGCLDCSVLHNQFRQLGGGGIKIGGSELDGALTERTGRITTSDNTISYIGKVFHQSVGILLTNAHDCTIAHNEVAHSCYTGISCGWSWGYRRTVTQDIRIEKNLIRDIGEGVLSDNGGIYLLGVQPGTVVRGNHVCRVTAADYGGWGIYPDEGSAHLLIEGNWVHDTQGPMLNIHYGREIVIRNNVFARSTEGGTLCVGRGEPHISANVFQNLFLGPAKASYQGAYAGDIRQSVRATSNLFHFPDGVPDATHMDFRDDVQHEISWQEWLAAGQDAASINADPMVTETERNLTFAPDSPISRIGFRPYDWSDCGPRPRPQPTK